MYFYRGNPQIRELLLCVFINIRAQHVGNGDIRDDTTVRFINKGCVVYDGKGLVAATLLRTYTDKR